MEFENEDKIISSFLESIGPWNKYAIIGGGYALFIYKLYFSDRKARNSPIGTRDIDSFLCRRTPIISKKNISRHLKEAGFTIVFKDMNQPATEAYIKDINGIEIEIEFLTDSLTRNDKQKNVVIAGVVAQPLNYLNLSLQMNMEFQTDAGQKGMVVSPGAWIFHKGLTFPKRKNIAKQHKDLYGIWYVTTQLGSFSKESVIELLSFRDRYPKWFKTFHNNLSIWLEQASPIDWLKLEIQDPFGKLKKLNFQKVISKLIS